EAVPSGSRSCQARSAPGDEERIGVRGTCKGRATIVAPGRETRAAVALAVPIASRVLRASAPRGPRLGRAGARKASAVLLDQPHRLVAIVALVLRAPRRAALSPRRPATCRP